MISKLKCLIIIFSQFLSLQLINAQSEINVKVFDPVGAPMAGVSVSIEGSPTFKTGANGTFKFTPTKKLEMPLEITAQKPGFKIKESQYIEEDSGDEIEIVMMKEEKVAAPTPTIITLFDEKKNPLKKFKINIGEASFVSDAKGEIKYKDNLPDKAKFKAQGYNLTHFDLNDKKKSLRIEFDKIEEPAVVQATVTPKNEPVHKVEPAQEVNPEPNKPVAVKEDTVKKDAPIAQASFDKNKVFQEYKEDFENLEKDILDEREWLEKKNTDIQNEMRQISERLKNEKGLSAEERKSLEKYLEHLEKLLEENSLAFHKSQEKSKHLLQKLRMMILAKDSINYITKLELAKAQKDKKIAEGKVRRNAIMFSIVTGALLLLAMVFYLIAMRMKKSKKSLEVLNKDMASQKVLIEEQNLQLDAFVGKASHDMKGPLKSVIGLTQVGMQSVKDPQSLEYFGHIHKSTVKLDKLLGELLELAKAKKAEVVKKDVNVLKVINECLVSFENFEGYNKVKFDIQVDPNLNLNTDENKFYSIVQNFIENGIKYKDGNKSQCNVTIKAQKDQNDFKMEFADNGLGIAPEHQPKIFDMFYKINDHTEGSGLGLHLVKVNIEKLGGSVNFESSLGKGTTFKVVMNNN